MLARALRSAQVAFAAIALWRPRFQETRAASAVPISKKLARQARGGGRFRRGCAATEGGGQSPPFDRLACLRGRGYHLMVRLFSLLPALLLLAYFLVALA